MASVDVRSKAGDVVGQATLAPELFEAQVNVPVMHQVVVAQMNARRAGTRDTKTRGEVRGGGRKPYRQKGTGRARQGSIRAPHYAGGGVVWGPHPRSYEVKVNRKVRAAALRSALSDRAGEGKVVVFDELVFEAPKTKDAVAALNAAGIVGKVLVVAESFDENTWRSFRNLPEVHTLTVDQLNVYDIIARDWLVFTKGALEQLNARAAGTDKAAAGTDKAAANEDGETA
jgi:large subunit ribosomal protein L4